MRTVWLTLLLLLTGVVAAGVVYVVVHNDPVHGAGETSGYSISSSATANASTGGRATTSSSSSSTSSSPGVLLRTVFLGDDYTRGEGASSKSASWTAIVSKRLSLSPVIVAESGAGYAKRSPNGRTYASLLPHVVTADPDLIIVSGGRNDVADAPETLAADAKSLFTDLHRKLPNATVIALAPWWGDSPHPSELGGVSRAVKAAVKAAGGIYLDAGDPLTGHPAWMADAADPNNSGYRAIAQIDGRALAPYIPS